MLHESYEPLHIQKGSKDGFKESNFSALGVNSKKSMDENEGDKRLESLPLYYLLILAQEGLNIVMADSDSYADVLQELKQAKEKSGEKIMSNPDMSQSLDSLRAKCMQHLIQASEQSRLLDRERKTWRKERTALKDTIHDLKYQLQHARLVSTKSVKTSASEAKICAVKLQLINLEYEKLRTTISTTLYSLEEIQRHWQHTVSELSELLAIWADASDKLNSSYTFLKGKIMDHIEASHCSSEGKPGSLDSLDYILDLNFNIEIPSEPNYVLLNELSKCQRDSPVLSGPSSKKGPSSSSSSHGDFVSRKGPNGGGRQEEVLTAFLVDFGEDFDRASAEDALRKLLAEQPSLNNPSVSVSDVVAELVVHLTNC